jgi:hypothetical protein
MDTGQKLQRILKFFAGNRPNLDGGLKELLTKQVSGRTRN